MDELPEEFYSAERWQNWLDTLTEEDIDPEEEDSARLLLNLQDDVALAVAKVLQAHQDELIDGTRANDEIEHIREIVLAEPDVENEETALLIDGVQTSLMCVFYTAEEYLADGPAEDGTVATYLQAAADAEANDELEAALGYTVQAGTLIVDGAKLDRELADEIEYGYVTEWINGLDSLAAAFEDPEVIEDE